MNCEDYTKIFFSSKYYSTTCSSLLNLQIQRSCAYGKLIISPGSSAGKNPPAMQDPGSIPGSGRSPGEGIGYPLQCSWASLVAQIVRNPPVMQRPGFDPWVGKIPCRRAWQPTPVFLPGESHGQRSLEGGSLWDRKESDMTE